MVRPPLKAVVPRYSESTRNQFTVGKDNRDIVLRTVVTVVTVVTAEVVAVVTPSGILLLRCLVRFSSPKLSVYYGKISLVEMTCITTFNYENHESNLADDHAFLFL